MRYEALSLFAGLLSRMKKIEEQRTCTHYAVPFLHTIVPGDARAEAFESVISGISPALEASSPHDTR
ncbi:hypothetical protein C8Q70DRAFT_965407 [Cubamyces menziesii]|nr:hypothetical protein C8Q70DRAFT_965407 [Cubamyces menziesii]